MCSLCRPQRRSLREKRQRRGRKVDAPAAREELSIAPPGSGTRQEKGPGKSDTGDMTAEADRETEVEVARLLVPPTCPT